MEVAELVVRMVILGSPYARVPLVELVHWMVGGESAGRTADGLLYTEAIRQVVRRSLGVFYALLLDDNWRIREDAAEIVACCETDWNTFETRLQWAIQHEPNPDTRHCLQMTLDAGFEEAS